MPRHIDPSISAARAMMRAADQAWSREECMLLGRVAASLYLREPQDA